MLLHVGMWVPAVSFKPGPCVKNVQSAAVEKYFRLQAQFQTWAIGEK
jgi:hypothetical protein